MGRPTAKKAAKKPDDSQPQKCASCTTRLRAPSAIYHTGDVGKFCHIAAEIKRKAEEQKKAAKQKVDVDLTRHTRLSSTDNAKSPKLDAIQKEIEALKKKFESTRPTDPKRKRKRKRSQSPDESQESSSESDPESESEEEPSPKPKHKKRRQDNTRSRWHTKGRSVKEQQRRDRAPSRYSDDDDESARFRIAPAVMAALPGLASIMPKKSGELRTSTDRAPEGAKWPHEWIKSSDPNTKVTPYNMTLAQFVYGYMECIEKGDVANCPYMIEHLKLSMLDIGRYGWDTVRRLQLVLFQQIESGDLTWAQTSGMNWFQTKMGLFTAPGPIPGSSSQSQVAGAAKHPAKPCPEFQVNACIYDGDHDGLHHICAFHYKHHNGMKSHSHGQADCDSMARKSRSGAKNPKASGEGEH